MRDIAILTFVTLDDVMQSPTAPDEDPSKYFTQGGWAQNCWAEVMAQVSQEAMAEPYDLLLGRKTYDIFAPVHSGDSPDQDSNFYKANKYVVSKTLENPSWHNTKIINADFIEQIKTLKQQDGPLLQIHGSGQLIQALLQHNLIDEFRIWTFPIVVGAGAKLFSEYLPPTDLKLVKSATTNNGAVMTIYRRNSKKAPL